MTKVQLCAALRKANLIRMVLSVLLGHDHKPSHRLIAGLCTMVVGITIYKVGATAENHVIAFVTDGVGFFVHGMGLVPFLEHLAASAE